MAVISRGVEVFIPIGASKKSGGRVVRLSGIRQSRGGSKSRHSERRWMTIRGQQSSAVGIRHMNICHLCLVYVPVCTSTLQYIVYNDSLGLLNVVSLLQDRLTLNNAIPLTL